MQDEGLWTTAECAAFLKISIHTLRAWKRRGVVPFLLIEGTVRYNPPDIRVWTASKSIGVAADREAV